MNLASYSTLELAISLPSSKPPPRRTARFMPSSKQKKPNCNVCARRLICSWKSTVSPNLKVSPLLCRLQVCCSFVEDIPRSDPSLPADGLPLKGRALGPIKILRYCWIISIQILRLPHPQGSCHHTRSIWDSPSRPKAWKHPAKWQLLDQIDRFWHCQGSLQTGYQGCWEWSQGKKAFWALCRHTELYGSWMHP